MEICHDSVNNHTLMVGQPGLLSSQNLVLPPHSNQSYRLLRINEDHAARRLRLGQLPYPYCGILSTSFQLSSSHDTGLPFSGVNLLKLPHYNVLKIVIALSL